MEFYYIIRQIIVSGIYIAHFEMPDGNAIRKFAVAKVICENEIALRQINIFFNCVI